ncbi:hypothetical protein [Azohydromonas caseinilytica]|uniref:Uncharacterized protein n=1 Tax=Azohydromonas caseinilytica TaxID=2728836 RepID=A0A848F8I1_9BURK|nr:hypothetical protein [Azohydromonas caseinilytica]NML14829.1 hypothetical protein [Azohydromonas caseinilytica]
MRNNAFILATGRRRVLRLGGLLGLLAIGPARAMWARMTEAELVRHSELIVVGEWVSDAPAPLPDTPAQAVGRIAVSEVWKGPPGLKSVQVVVPSGLLAASDAITYRRGDRGLWLLRPWQGGAGLYAADSPQRFVREGSDAALVKALRQELGRR